MDNPFPGLLDSITSTKSALVAPLVLAPGGTIEDSVRRFPNFQRLVTRLFIEQGSDYPLAQEQAPVFPDWVAGMFMLFRAEDFARLRGFDEGFRLYYEDVDICVRTWKMGRPVSVCPQVSVIHDAQRTSRRNLRYMRWHLASMARYLLKHWGRLPVVQAK
ncbi:hypothetical protein FQZ97_1014710 [compost metagenome]